jgi:cation-transporting ATPase I
VASAELNYPLSRLVVRLDGDGPTLGTLCDMVTAAEHRACGSGAEARRERPTDLPGDGVILGGRIAAVLSMPRAYARP